MLYFHNFYNEWDVISYYIPAAKGIITSHGLTSQPYVSLNFFDVSPATPISYAFVLNFLDNASLFALPIIYFVLTLVTLFLLHTSSFQAGRSLFQY